MAGENMAAGITGLGMYPLGGYQNLVGLNDYTDYDNFGLNPYSMMGMNGSIFGGVGAPMMPGFGGNWMQTYYKNMEDYQNFMIDSGVRQKQRMRRGDIQLNAPEEGVQRQALLLKDKIMRNEQEQIQQAYIGYLSSIKELYPNASEQELVARAETLYAKQFNSTIENDIRQYGSGSFTQGVKQGLGFGIFADKYTAEENVSKITGQPVGRWEKTKKTTGNIIGAGAVGVGAGFLTKAIFKNKIAAIAAGVAAGIGVLIKAFKSNS